MKHHLRHSAFCLFLAGKAMADDSKSWQQIPFTPARDPLPAVLQCLLNGRVETPIGITSMQVYVDGNNRNLGSAQWNLKLSIPLEKFRH